MNHIKETLKDKNGDAYIWLCVIVVFISMLLSVLILYMGLLAQVQIQKREVKTKLDSVVSEYATEMFGAIKQGAPSERYTDDPKVGYLSKNGVEQMRSALGNHIFRDDLQHIFREQTEKRNELKKDWHTLLEKILADMAENPNTHPEIEARLAELSLRLSRTKGKKVYGYLKRDLKDLIDEIVDLLAKDENIAKLYDLWYEKKYEALRTYTSEVPPKIPLSQNKEFKSIKNDIIREALRMSQSGEQKQESRTDSDTATHHSSEKNSAPHNRANTVRATAVTGLLKNLANTFQDKILGDDAKKLPTIDKRQRREIEEKKNAEIGYTM